MGAIRIFENDLTATDLPVFLEYMNILGIDVSVRGDMFIFPDTVSFTDYKNLLNDYRTLDAVKDIKVVLDTEDVYLSSIKLKDYNQTICRVNIDRKFNCLSVYVSGDKNDTTIYLWKGSQLVHTFSSNTSNDLVYFYTENDEPLTMGDITIKAKGNTLVSDIKLSKVLRRRFFQ
jgi:hypothetical protein